MAKNWSKWLEKKTQKLPSSPCIGLNWNPAFVIKNPASFSSPCIMDGTWGQRGTRGIGPGKTGRVQPLTHQDNQK